MNRSSLLVALAIAAAAAQAHDSHGTRRPQAAMPKEQKPWGIAGDPPAVVRTIDIAMTDDMRFRPSGIRVREGETVRLRVKNRGQVLHELVIGTPDELQAHAALMQKFPGMEHDEPYMTHVKAGASGDIVWNFNRPGTFEFACLIPGHFQAGMKGTIQVHPRKEPAR